MASYSKALSAHKTLTAATVDTVTLTVDYPGVEVLNRDTTGAMWLWFTIDGSTPTSAGDDTYAVPPGGSVTIRSGWTSDSVKLISASACPYSVTGVQ